MEQLNDLLYELELTYKPDGLVYSRKHVKSSIEVYKLLRQLFCRKTIACQEEVIVLYLNHCQLPLGYLKLGKGGMSSVVVDNRIILSAALKSLATSIIIAHNHPSGNVIPSDNDKIITNRLLNACFQLDIKLIDHIIVGPVDKYFSFADDGLL